MNLPLTNLAPVLADATVGGAAAHFALVYGVVSAEGKSATSTEGFNALENFAIRLKSS